MLAPTVIARECRSWYALRGNEIMASENEKHSEKSPLVKPYGRFVKRIRTVADGLLDDLSKTVDQQAEVNSLTGEDRVRADVLIKLVDALNELTRGVMELKNGNNPSNKSQS
jgi:hypothetical protein